MSFKISPKYSVTIMFIICLFTMACSSESSIDKSKFQKISTTAQDIMVSIVAGAPYKQIADRVQEFSHEIADLKGGTTSQRERDLVRDYSDLLSTYKDGLLLWKYKLEFAAFNLKLKGRIYVGQDVEPIVLKYGFVTQTHIYRPTGQYWKSIEESSIEKIWETANFKLTGINNSMNYKY